MPETDRAKAIVTGVVQRISGVVGRGAPTAQQTLTIAVPAERVAAAWRDPATLSQVLGDAGSVQDDGEGRYRWSLTPPGGGGQVTWTSTLTEDATSVRHTSAAAADLGGTSGGGDHGDDGGTGHEVALSLAPAPQDLGTEATLRLDLPVPGLVAGGLAFTLLYRLRALLLTGELPTITPQPAARAAER